LWTWQDLSNTPALICEECGAVVSPEVIEYVTDTGIDWVPSGTFVAWTCGSCGHTRMSAIFADVTEEELEELERQEEEGWLFEHQYAEY
jgi:RNase P subunit RPR2